MNAVLTEVRDKLSEIITILSEYDKLDKIEDERNSLNIKYREVEKLVAKKADIEERTTDLVRRERIIERKENEFRDKTLSLSRREDELKAKMERVNKILQE